MRPIVLHFSFVITTDRAILFRSFVSSSEEGAMLARPLDRPSRNRREPVRRRRADGEKSHRAILRAAAELASTHGLEGLTLAQLAARLGISKSGLFAHFRSKQALELATVEAAGEVFAEDVMKPALAAPPGVERLVALSEAFLSHLERRVFPGGCFFAAAAAELDSRPGPVRDRIAAFQRGWMRTLETHVREARERGELDRSADPPQIAFEVQAMLLAANAAFLLQGDPSVFERARRGVVGILERAASA
jgi:AcrR family transcriptional regulator